MMPKPPEGREPRRTTVLFCPECGEHRPYSAMDHIHGQAATCGCWGLLEDEQGVVLGTHGPSLVSVPVREDAVCPSDVEAARRVIHERMGASGAEEADCQLCDELARAAVAAIFPNSPQEAQSDG